MLNDDPLLSVQGPNLHHSLTLQTNPPSHPPSGGKAGLLSAASAYARGAVPCPRSDSQPLRMQTQAVGLLTLQRGSNKESGDLEQCALAPAAHSQGEEK